MEKIIVLGAGGYAEQLLWVVSRIESKEIVGFLDETISEDKKISGIPVKSSLERFGNVLDYKDIRLICAVGNIDLREKWVSRYKDDFNFTSIIDPTAIIADDVHIGNNVIILGQTVLSSKAHVADHTNINWFCLITHHTIIGRFTNISSGVRLTGHASIGDYCDIGTNVTIIPYKKVGNHSIIGAGAVIINDIPEYSVAVGIPAKVIKKNIYNPL